MTSIISTTTSIFTLGEMVGRTSLAPFTPISSNQKSNHNAKASKPRAISKKNAHCHLEINVVEGRNLTIADATKANIYCVVCYDGNVTCTLDKNEDDDFLALLKSTTTSSKDEDTTGGIFRAFEMMMKASSPKWMHRVNFDVSSSDKEILLYVYDRGNKSPNGKDRCLGMSSIVPCLVNNRTVELIFPLKGQPHGQEEVTGDVRLQVTYTHNQAKTFKSKDSLKKGRHILDISSEDEDPEIDFWWYRK